jgi:predicted dehydrogenase
MRSLLLSLFVLSCLSSALAEEPKKAAGAPGVEPAFEIADLPDAATSVAIDPQGSFVVVGSYECVEVWDLKTAKKLQRVPIKTGFIRSLAFSPDSKHLAAGGYQAITIVEVEGWKPSPKWKGHRAYVSDLTYLADGGQLVSSSEDMTVRLWNAADGTEVRKIGKFTDPVAGVAISPDGKLAATVSGDETRLSRPGDVKIWSVETGELVSTLPPHQKPPLDVVFSPDGKSLVSTSMDEKVNVYDVAAGKAIGFFGGHQRPTTCAAFLDGGRLVASGCGGRFKGGNEVRIWTREEGEEVAAIELEEGKVTDLAVSADGAYLAVSVESAKGLVFKVDLKTLGGKAEGDEKPAETGGREIGRNGNGVASRGLPPHPRPLSPEYRGEGGDPSPARESLFLTALDEPQGADAPRSPAEAPKAIRIGIIGLDTSHSVAFTTVLNAEIPKPEFAGCRIVAAYPWGSRDIESSKARIPEYTKKVEELGVKVVGSIEELLPLVDCVLLETNDGRPHLEQVIPVLRAGKPVFVDKPIAGSLADAVAIFEVARKHKTPLFSSSSLRFIPEALAARKGDYGDVIGCDAFSPCSLEGTHPDLFWYGIHGVEILFTVMGTGCDSVTRASTKDTDFVTGTWAGGRVGTFRGTRSGKSGYGGTAFCEKQTTPLGNFKGYEPLIVEIVKFFRSGEVPVTEAETLEIYAFMEAADESKRQGGKPVLLKDVMEKAKAEAETRLQALVK